MQHPYHGARSRRFLLRTGLGEPPRSVRRDDPFAASRHHLLAGGDLRLLRLSEREVARLCALRIRRAGDGSLYRRVSFHRQERDLLSPRPLRVRLGRVLLAVGDAAHWRQLFVEHHAGAPLQLGAAARQTFGPRAARAGRAPRPQERRGAPRADPDGDGRVRAVRPRFPADSLRRFQRGYRQRADRLHPHGRRLARDVRERSRAKRASPPMPSRARSTSPRSRTASISSSIAATWRCAMRRSCATARGRCTPATTISSSRSSRFAERREGIEKRAGLRRPARFRFGGVFRRCP